MVDIFESDFLKNGKHVRWINLKKTNPFAFSFDYNFWHDSISKSLNDKIIKTILKKKNYNVKNKKFVLHDMEYTTWIKDNIFKWKNKEIKLLKNSIKNILKNFFNQINYKQKEKIYIQGWPSVLKKDQSHSEHFHDDHEYSFLSGNIILTDNKTTTDYNIYPRSCQFGYYKCKNFPGSVTIFSSYISHKVDIIKDDLRMSIGFNLYTQTAMDHFVKTKEFQDPLNPIYFSIEL
jgi:hypothetical protein